MSRLLLYSSCYVLHTPSACTYDNLLASQDVFIGERERANLVVHLAAKFHITGAAHTVIPIQRQHTHKIATSVYSAGRCVSLQKARRKRRHDYPDAKVYSRDRAKRAAQSSQATKNSRGSETAEARERTDRDRRKRRLDSESAKEKDTRYRYIT